MVSFLLAMPARAHEGDGRPHQHTSEGTVTLAESASLPRRSPSLPFLVTGAVAILLGVSMLVRNAGRRDGPGRAVRSA